MFLLEWVQRAQGSLQGVVDSLERRSFAFAVFVMALRGFNEDNAMHLAAGVAYFALFSIFPLILGFIALASFVLQSAEARDTLIAAITGALPGTAEVVRQNIDLVLRERGTIGLISALILLWSAKAVFGAITTSMDLIWNVKETRPFLQRTALELGLVVAVGLFLLISLLATTVLQLLALFEIPVLGTHPIGRDIWTLLVALLPLAFTILAFFLVYRFVPNTKVTTQDAWTGAITAAVLFEVTKNVFVYYTSTFANYRLVYGSISAVIALLFWAWLSSAILMLGAEICVAYSTLGVSGRDRQR